MRDRSTMIMVALALVFTTAAAAQESRLVIPAAGSVPGQNGTFFRSDITILNLRGVEQRVALEWVPAEVSGADLPPTIVTIAPYRVLTSEDFVTEVLGQSGLGAIVIRAIGASGTEHDPEGRLYATSRIWTPQPGVDGTTSQTMPAVPLSDVVHEQVAFVGHRIDGRYRVNVGVVNLDRDTEQSFVIYATGSIVTVDPATIFVNLKPYSMSQVRVNWPDDPELRVDVRVLPQHGGGHGTFWIPYLSSVDNVTGDSWSSLGVELEAQ